jgi:hypothetical protein
MGAEPLGPHAAIVAHLEAGPRKVTDSIPTDYAGTHFRSRLEAGWATTLDRYGIRWEYEQELAELPSGVKYLPDFRLPELATVIEVKGPHMQRLDKTREYAKENHPETIVLIGYPPMHRKLSLFTWESYMQWGGALGYPALLTECLSCCAYQWCIPRFSMRCRKCREKFTGHFAANGEMRFDNWKEQPYEDPFRKGTIVLMPWFRVDDGFHSHPKTLSTSLSARGLWVTAGSWSSAHLTNGVVRPQDLASLGGSSELAAELVASGLWEKRRGGGWKFHEWESKNPTKEAVENERKAAAERQRRSRQAHSSRRDSRGDNGVSHTTPSRRDGTPKNGVPVPSRVAAGRASPEGSPAVAAKPPWCGECDERTRLLGDDPPRRCPACHPLAQAVP